MGYNRKGRAEQAEAVAEAAPELHARLLELRAANPQAYRKRLKRLQRDGLPEAAKKKTSKGRAKKKA